MTGINATVGGDTPEEGNLISGNAAHSIQLLGVANAFKNRVAGNFIGTDKDGLAALGNAGHGVLLCGFAAENTIGGLTHESGNTIAFNGGDGVSVNASKATSPQSCQAQSSSAIRSLQMEVLELIWVQTE
jgi:hypothetical protein